MSLVSFADRIAAALALKAPSTPVSFRHLLMLCEEPQTASSMHGTAGDEREGVKMQLRRIQSNFIENPPTKDLANLNSERQKTQLLLLLSKRSDIDVMMPSEAEISRQTSSSSSRSSSRSRSSSNQRRQQQQPQSTAVSAQNDPADQTVQREGFVRMSAESIRQNIEQQSFESVFRKVRFLPAQQAVSLQRGLSIPDSRLGKTALDMLSIVAQGGEKGVTGKEISEKLGIDSKSIFHHMLPLLDRGLVNKTSEILGSSKFNRYQLFRYATTDQVSYLEKAFSQVIDFLKDTETHTLKLNESLMALGLSKTERENLRGYIESNQGSANLVEIVFMNWDQLSNDSDDESIEFDELPKTKCIRLKQDVNVTSANVDVLDLNDRNESNISRLQRQILSQDSSVPDSTKIPRSVTNRRKVFDIKREIVWRIAAAGAEGICSTELQHQLGIHSKLFYRILEEIRKSSSVTTMTMFSGRSSEHCLFISQDAATAKKLNQSYHPTGADAEAINHFLNRDNRVFTSGGAEERHQSVMMDQKNKSLRRIVEYAVRKWRIVHRSVLKTLAGTFDKAAYGTSCDRRTILRLLDTMQEKGTLKRSTHEIYHEGSNKNVEVPLVADPSVSEEEVNAFLQANSKVLRNRVAHYEDGTSLLKLLEVGELPREPNEVLTTETGEDSDTDSKDLEQNMAASSSQVRERSIRSQLPKVKQRRESTSKPKAAKADTKSPFVSKSSSATTVEQKFTATGTRDSGPFSLVGKSVHEKEPTESGNLFDFGKNMRLQSLQKSTAGTRIVGHMFEKLVAPYVKARSGKFLRAALLHRSVLQYVARRCNVTGISRNETTYFDLNHFLLDLTLIEYVQIVGLPANILKSRNVMSLLTSISRCDCIKDLPEEYQKALIERGSQISKLQTVLRVLVELNAIERTEHEVEIGAEHNFAKVTYAIKPVISFPPHRRHTACHFTDKKSDRKRTHGRVLLDISNQVGIEKLWKDLCIISNSLRSNSKVWTKLRDENCQDFHSNVSIPSLTFEGNEPYNDQPVIGFPADKTYKIHEDKDIFELYYLDLADFKSSVLQTLAMQLPEFTAQVHWLPSSAVGTEKCNDSGSREMAALECLKELNNSADRKLKQDFYADEVLPPIVNITEKNSASQPKEHAPRTQFPIADIQIQGKGHDYSLSSELITSVGSPAGLSHQQHKTVTSWSRKEDNKLLQCIVEVANKSTKRSRETTARFDSLEEAILQLLTVSTKIRNDLLKLLQFLDPFWTSVAHQTWEKPEACRHRFVYLLSANSELVQSIQESLRDFRETDATTASYQASVDDDNLANLNCNNDLLQYTHSHVCPAQQQHVVDAKRFMLRNAQYSFLIPNTSVGDIPKTLYSAMDKLLRCHLIRSVKPNKGMSMRSKRGDVMFPKWIQNLYKEKFQWLARQVGGRTIGDTFDGRLLSDIPEDCLENQIPEIVERFHKCPSFCYPIVRMNEDITLTGSVDEPLTLKHLLGQYETMSSFDIAFNTEESLRSQAGHDCGEWDLPSFELRDGDMELKEITQCCPYDAVSVKDAINVVNNDDGGPSAILGRLSKWCESANGSLSSGYDSVGVSCHTDSETSTPDKKNSCRSLVKASLFPRASEEGISGLACYHTLPLAYSYAAHILSCICRYPGVSKQDLVEMSVLLSEFEVHMLLNDLVHWKLIHIHLGEDLRSKWGKWSSRFTPLNVTLLHERKHAIFPSDTVRFCLQRSPLREAIELLSIKSDEGSVSETSGNEQVSIGRKRKREK